MVGRQGYDAGKSYVSPNSADVLIPAFISAYSGRDVNSSSLDILPNLLSILPNWKVTYHFTIDFR